MPISTACLLQHHKKAGVTQKHGYDVPRDHLQGAEAGKEGQDPYLPFALPCPGQHPAVL